MILFRLSRASIQYSERRRQMELDFRTLGLEIAIVVAAEGSAFYRLTVEEIERQAEGTFFIVASSKPALGRRTGRFRRRA